MFKPDKIKLVYCYFGNGIALGAYGEKDEIEKAFNALYNFGGHEDEPRFMSDGFGYVLTTKGQLLHGLKSAFVTEAVHHKIDEPKEARVGVWPIAQEQAQKAFETMKLEQFLNQGTPAQVYSFPHYKD